MGNRYITIFEWMTGEMNLHGVSLLVYACIYGFPDHACNASLQYFATLCGTTKRAVQNALNELENRGIVKRKRYVDKGVQRALYTVDERDVSVCTGEETSPHEETSCGGVKKLRGRGEETSWGCRKNFTQYTNCNLVARKLIS